MEAVRLILRYLHLVGFALLLGSWLTAYLSQKFKVNFGMLAGSATQVATGVVLSAPFDRDEDLDYAKITVKLVLALAIAAMVWVPYWKRRDTSARGHFIGIGAMTLLTAGVATFWT